MRLTDGHCGLGAYYNDPTVTGGDDFVGAGSPFEAVRLLPMPTANQFHHLAGTYRQVDPSHIELTLFVDGQLVKTATLPGNLTNTLNDVPLTIGASSPSGYEGFRGLIDEVSVYNRALSTDEIRGIVNAGSAGKCKDKPPQADAGGPYSVVEGDSVMLDGSGSSDPDQPASTLSYEWDLDGDNILGETGAAATRGDETGIAPIFSAAGLTGPSTVTVSLRVTDNGGLTNTDTATIQVFLRPPLTVITHGFIPDGVFPTWVYDMAVAIEARLDLPPQAHCTRSQIESSSFFPGTVPDNLGCSHFLLLDWASISRQPGPTGRQAAVTSLSTWVTDRINNTTSPVDIHFIGHSRGTVVNSQVIQQLGPYEAGLGDVQMTSLDPHPSSLFSDPDVAVGSVVDWADNYYQQGGRGPDGQPIPGALNIDLSSVTGICALAVVCNIDGDEGWPGRSGASAEHAEVHD